MALTALSLLGLSSVVSHSIKEAKQEENLEPNAVYKRTNLFNKQIEYEDINGNGKFESVFIDPATNKKYVLERDPETKLLKIYSVER